MLSEPGSSSLIGYVVGVHLADQFLDSKGRFDPVRAGLIARLGGPDYSLLDSTFEMLRPIVGDEDSGARLESD
jgi:flavin reductase (DIM6/NTAB) family NADH-FMN oxidoreductase RutF